MRMVGPFFLSWVQEVIRDEEVAVIFLKEFWPRIVGEGLATSTTPLRLRKRTLEIGVSGREWERVLHGMAQPLMTKVNAFWNRSLVRRLDFQVVQPAARRLRLSGLEKRRRLDFVPSNRSTPVRAKQHPFQLERTHALRQERF